MQTIGSLVHKQLRYGLLKFKFLHTKLSYLVLDPVLRSKR